jgi:DHA1 family bicyclomycin/chloramphenicol resistance-like MFS transporter
MLAYWGLHETNADRSSAHSVRELLGGYGLLSRSRLFWGYVLATGFTSAAFFAFLAGAPFVTIELMGRSPAEYGLYFAFVPSGYMLGNFASGRFATRVGSNRLILAGLVICAAGVAAMALVFGMGVMRPAALFVPMFFIGAGNGLVLPSGIAGAVSVRPELAGAAAGLSGTLQIGSGALVAPLVGAMLGTTVWPLIPIMMASSVLAPASLALAASRRSSKPGG